MEALDFYITLILSSIITACLLGLILNQHSTFVNSRAPEAHENIVVYIQYNIDDQETSLLSARAGPWKGFSSICASATDYCMNHTSSSLPFRLLVAKIKVVPGIAIQLNEIRNISREGEKPRVRS